MSGNNYMDNYMHSYLTELIESKKHPDLMCEHVVKKKQVWAYCTMQVLKNPVGVAVGYCGA